MFQQGCSKGHADKMVGQKTRSVGASLLANNLQAPQTIWFGALSFTIIASKLAPTGTAFSARFRAINLDVPPKRSTFHPVHRQSAP
ncbi:hypothetical protein EMIT0P291_10204 [Pseudomonas sp. IT-P291]